MARIASILPLAALGLVLAGCDPAVEARQHPSSVDEVFGAFSHVGGIELEVYELPAAPAALNPAELRQIPDDKGPPLRRHGQVMKPVAMVGYRTVPEAERQADPTPLVAMEEPLPAGMPLGIPYRIASWNQHRERGAKESLTTPPYAPHLDPGHSVYTNEPQKLGAYQVLEPVWDNDKARLR